MFQKFTWPEDWFYTCSIGTKLSNGGRKDFKIYDRMRGKQRNLLHSYTLDAFRKPARAFADIPVRFGDQNYLLEDEDLTLWMQRM